jgi:hypothetical protein
MEFNNSKESLDIWHLPNIREDLNGPIQPEVVRLDTQFLYCFVEQSPEEESGRGDEVL